MAHTPLPVGPLIHALLHPPSVFEDPGFGKALLDDQGGGKLYDKCTWYTPARARSRSLVLVAGSPGSAALEDAAAATRNV